VLVNRGWVPQSRGPAASRLQGQVPVTVHARLQVEGETAISGVLRLTEDTSSLVPANREETERWHSRDVAALARRLDTLPLLLDLDLASSQAAAGRGGPVGGQTRVQLRNDHVQYMLTW
jgi:surfeit locus 1 family protein